MASVMSQCTSTCRRRWQCVCVQVEKKAKAIALCDERRSPRTDLHRPVAVAERLCCCQLRGAVLPPVTNCKQASESNKLHCKQCFNYCQPLLVVQCEQKQVEGREEKKKWWRWWWRWRRTNHHHRRQLAHD